MAHELRQRYANMVDARLRKTLVSKEGVIFNTKFEGQPVSGSVKIPVRPDMVSAAYDKQAGKDAQIGETKYITVIMKDAACNELIDGFDAAAVPDNIIADRLDSAGYALALTQDNTAMKVLINGAAGKDESGTAFPSGDPRNGKTGTVISKDVTKADIYATLLDLNEKLDEAGVPANGRWVILSPKAYRLVLESDDFIKRGDISQELVAMGALGEIAGMTVFKSNNLPQSADSKAVYAVASHPDFCTAVAEWAVLPEVVDIRDGKHIGASVVQGRRVYNYAVTKPEAVGIIESAS